MRRKPWLQASGVFGIALAVALALAMAVPVQSQDQQPTIIPLPADERATLEQYLGKDVVGEAIAAEPLDDPTAWCGHRSAIYHVKRISGSGGPATQWKISRGDDPSGRTWRGEIDGVVRSIRISDAGDVEIESETDPRHGVISRFTPPERRLSKSMKPGQTDRLDIAVQVFDMNHPDQLKHHGTLAVTNTYVGAYRVKVPAGTYDAILMRSQYKGEIDPASINTTIHYLLAKDVGPVAFVEVKSISAMLFYHDDEKVGMVLERVEVMP